MSPVTKTTCDQSAKVSLLLSSYRLRSLVLKDKLKDLHEERHVRLSCEAGSGVKKADPRTFEIITDYGREISEIANGKDCSKIAREVLSRECAQSRDDLIRDEEMHEESLPIPEWLLKQKIRHNCPDPRKQIRLQISAK